MIDRTRRGMYAEPEIREGARKNMFAFTYYYTGAMDERG